MAQELFTYDWHMDDAPAIFQVDMAVPAEALSCRPYMLYIQGKSRKEALTPREERHLAALFKKAEKTLDALFVGSIHVAARQVFFFYTDDAEQGSQAKALIAQEKVLDCTAGLRDDPAGDTYHKLLYPDAARLFTQQNRQQIDLLNIIHILRFCCPKLIFHGIIPFFLPVMQHSELLAALIARRRGAHFRNHTHSHPRRTHCPCPLQAGRGSHPLWQTPHLPVGSFNDLCRCSV